jgi:hypothetical protein
MLNWVFRHYVKIAFAAALLVSANAHAGPSQGVNLATAEPPPLNEPSPPTSSNATQAPSAATTPVTIPETTTPATPQPTVVAKPTRRKMTIESRIIYELHRHGIYW